MRSSKSANGSAQYASRWILGSLALFVTVVSVEVDAAAAAATFGVRNPGRVLVDTEPRHSYLKTLPVPELRQLCPIKVSAAIPPVRSIEGTHGPDTSAIQATARIMDYGAACLAGVTDSCQKIVSIMDTWATSNAFEVIAASRKGAAFWNVTLTANLGLKPMIASYAIARKLVVIEPATDTRVIGWLNARVAAAENTDEYPVNAAQNHFIMSAGTQMAMGALSGDASLFTKGIVRWRKALADMRPDGSFPLETRRGSKALWYTLLQLNALMSIGEIAALQGYYLYSERSAGGSTIHDAVSFAIGALENQDRIRTYARERVAAPQGSPDEQDLSALDSLMAWVEPYMNRFPTHPNTIHLSNLELDASTCSIREYAPGGCKRTESRKLAQILSRPLRSNWFGGVTSCMQGKIPFMAGSS